VGWGDGFLDFDNDGWKDLFIVNGGLHWLIPMEDSLLHNNGNGTFTDISDESGATSGPRKSDGAHASRTMTTTATLMRSSSFGRQRYFAARETSGGQRAEPLADIEADRNEEQSRWFWSAHRSGGGRSPANGGECAAIGIPLAKRSAAHFGLGSHTQVDRLTIHWPSGTVQNTGKRQSRPDSAHYRAG